MRTALPDIAKNVAPRGEFEDVGLALILFVDREKLPSSIALLLEVPHERPCAGLCSIEQALYPGEFLVGEFVAQNEVVDALD